MHNLCWKGVGPLVLRLSKYERGVLGDLDGTTDAICSYTKIPRGPWIRLYREGIEGEGVSRIPIRTNRSRATASWGKGVIKKKGPLPTREALFN